MPGYLLNGARSRKYYQRAHRQEMPRFTGQDFPAATQGLPKMGLCRSLCNALTVKIKYRFKGTVSRQTRHYVTLTANQPKRGCAEFSKGPNLKELHATFLDCRFGDWAPTEYSVSSGINGSRHVSVCGLLEAQSNTVPRVSLLRPCRNVGRMARCKRETHRAFEN